MNENLKPDPHAPRSVNVTEPWTRAYWARYFEVPVEAVEDAVATVGEDPSAVAAHLGKSWPAQDGGGIV
ncbi:hypothetical protein ASF27_10630 [Methylobacterium sp. Leaf102]|uniref:DUF3606 domain-containing protein n=1 Tax=Methylobacterium sp. Leaf102 TaxID=1736253 RepID=UPI0006FC9857|nr:DUF3606 domain-containing protein [Methylobacterium sp. Leaf102]KQP24549.1 hypothetical protein ASF27_10630 [Methylobacterium sp. Leaf102]